MLLVGDTFALFQTYNPGMFVDNRIGSITRSQSENIVIALIITSNVLLVMKLLFSNSAQNMYNPTGAVLLMKCTNARPIIVKVIVLCKFQRIRNVIVIFI